MLFQLSEKRELPNAQLSAGTHLPLHAEMTETFWRLAVAGAHPNRFVDESPWPVGVATKGAPMDLAVSEIENSSQFDVFGRSWQQCLPEIALGQGILSGRPQLSLFFQVLRVRFQQREILYARRAVSYSPLPQQTHF